MNRGQVAGNGEVIATSQQYHSKESALHGIKSVQANAAGATVDDQTEAERAHGRP